MKKTTKERRKRDRFRWPCAPRSEGGRGRKKRRGDQLNFGIGLQLQQASWRIMRMIFCKKKKGMEGRGKWKDAIEDVGPATNSLRVG